jgi:predicted Zn-dependent protease
LTARDDGEFAGILAHAMAHVAARPGTRQASKTEVSQLMRIPLTRAVAGVGTSDASRVLIPISMVSFSRAYEQEADRIGVTMASMAGYDPEGLIRYLSRQPVGTVQDSDGRIAAMRTLIQSLPHPASSEFIQIQNQLRSPR